MTHDELGIWGERKAVEYLMKRRFSILDQNVRFRRNEIDIVAIDSDSNELVVVEVKTRQTARIGPPWKAVTRSKQRQIIQVAYWLVKDRQIYRNLRFDIVSIVHNSHRTEIEHIRNAFGP